MNKSNEIVITGGTENRTYRVYNMSRVVRKRKRLDVVSASYSLCADSHAAMFFPRVGDTLTDGGNEGGLEIVEISQSANDFGRDTENPKWHRTLSVRAKGKRERSY